MFVTALLSLALAGAPCRAEGSSTCTCVQDLARIVDTLDAARHALANSSALFTGRVIATHSRRDSVAVTPSTGGRRWWQLYLVVATIVVQTKVKGVVPDTVVVETDRDYASCGADLSLNGEYLIDASVGPSGILYTQHCGFTRSLTGSGRLVEFLLRARDR